MTRTHPIRSRENPHGASVEDSYSSWLKNPNELASLIKVVNQAIAEQRFDQALRFADRAWRLAPTDPTLAQITMSLQLQRGDADQAIRILSGLPAHKVNSGVAALHIDALRLLDAIPEAGKQLGHYLSVFAVEYGGALAEAANALLETGAWQGWLGVTPGMHLIGRIRCQDGSDTVLLSQEQDGADIETIMVPARDGWSDIEALQNIPVSDRMIFRPLGGDLTLLGAHIRTPALFGLTANVTVDRRRIRGSVRMTWQPEHHVPLLTLEKRDGIEDVPLTPYPAEPGLFEFDISFGKFELTRWSADDIKVTLPDGRKIALGAFAADLRGIKPYRPARRSRPASRMSSAAPAIIIPVYKGIDETIACIESVLWTAGDDQPVIVINDASPEPDMDGVLAAYSDDPRVRILKNASNIGFPASANLGMAAVPDHDVILLNADTRVFHGWVERLVAHAEADPDIATITPLSNAGSIASYPGGEEAPCDEQTARLYDRLAGHANAGVCVEVPTGVGFCLFIRRACLGQIGDFDEDLFGRGYGEENDFCMRAAAHGWKHVIAGDVLVYHHNGVSFGVDRQALRQRNGAILSARHPSYTERIEAFHDAQPLRAVRRTLDIARLQKDKRPCVLLLSLALDGGVARHVRDRVKRLEADGYAPLVLRPDDDGKHIVITSSVPEEYPDLKFSPAADRQALADLIGHLSIDHVEIHHFLGLDETIVDLCMGAGAPIDIFLHDYSWYCPRISLLGTRGTYCGEPGLKTCRSCVEQAGSELHDALGPDALRARSLRWLSQARARYAPCEDVVSRYAATFPKLDFQTLTWESGEYASIPVPREIGLPHRIAVIGAIGEQKGHQVLLACARHAALHELPIEFVLIGFAEDDEALLKTGKVFITGRYATDELPDLLIRERPSAIFLPSVTPETWSYTLSEALSTDLPILAFDIGAVAARLSAHAGPHQLLPLDSPTARINAALAMLADGQSEEKSPSRSDDINPPAPSSLATPLPAASPLTIRTPGASIMRDTEKGLQSSAEFLSLARGLYHFSVAGGGAQSAGSLPALQVAIAPGQNRNDIECVSSPGAEHLWLCGGQDSVILKVNKDQSRVVVILLTVPGLAPLQIDVRKLDGEQGAYAFEQPSIAQRPDVNGMPPVAVAGANLVRSQIVVHAEFVGDVIGMDQVWAGAPMGGRSIECITITPIASLAPASIEYMAIGANGQETPWVDQGRPCGSRGMALPLLGFAIRQKPHVSARFLCEYSGRFASGRIVGPLQDGQMCRSPQPNDRLEAVWFHIVDMAAQPAMQQPVTSGAPAPPDNPRAIGPRFSIFREIQA